MPAGSKRRRLGSTETKTKTPARAREDTGAPEAPTNRRNLEPEVQQLLSNDTVERLKAVERACTRVRG